MKTQRMIAYATLILVMSLLLGSFNAPARAASVNVKILPGSAEVSTQQTLALSVQVENVNDLYGAEVHILYDPALLEVVDADAATGGVQIAHGSLLSADFVAQNQVELTQGKIDYAIAQMPPQSAVNGSGTLASITFRGIAPGVSAVSIEAVLLSDTNGQPISSAKQNGSVTVIGSNPTPTPTPTPTPSPTANPTPGPTPIPMPTATPTPGSGICTPIQGYHSVRAGETLYAIGRTYATKPRGIAHCNNIVNPNRLAVGSKLGIPVDPWAPIPPGSSATRQFGPGGGTEPTPTATPTCRHYHKVRYGETLSLIAWRYGSNIWHIARVNHIHNLNLIYAGQILCIP